MMDLLVRFAVYFVLLCLYDKYIYPRIPAGFLRAPREPGIRYKFNIVLALLCAAVGWLMYIAIH